MRVINEVVNNNREVIGYSMHCPGCDHMHIVWTNRPDAPQWKWNGSFEKPTFSPSLLLTAPYHGDPKRRRCHSFIREGRWEFLSDCTHNMAGKTVNMVEEPE